ncbi:MAG: hypothetical protein FJX75_06820 [Armatimonadetes bacterium]|nr:hypothetical protein [Armatimonadota bacterium]
MKLTIALTGCATIAPELERCCRELGLPTTLYAARPACLFEGARRETRELVARAGAERDALLIAFGQCCGEFEVEGAGVVAASRCTEMLLGAGTHSWITEQGVLPLPPPYFDAWLNDPKARPEVERVLTSSAAAIGLGAIAAIDQAERESDPRGIAEIERICGRPSRRLFTGLGHLRENLREAAEAAGLSAGMAPAEPIPATALGPGDDCLAVVEEAQTGRQMAVDTIAAGLSRGLTCVWVTDDPASAPIADRLGGEARESGQLQVIGPEALLAETNAAGEPQFLVANWIERATEALTAGGSGLCLIHGGGWGEAAGLSSDYLLAYASRLSAACSRWPILSLCACAPGAVEPSVWEELRRTHPLVSEAGVARVSPRFVRSEEYLGAESLLQTLGHQPTTFTCADVQPLISALADGELDGPAAVALAHHAQSCARCGGLLRQHRETKQSLSALRVAVEGIADELWARVSARLHE